MKLIRYFIIVVAIVVALFSTTTNSLDQAQIAAIDEYIQNQFLPINHIPGLGLSIVHDSSSLAKGYGLRDLEKGLLTTANTYFAIGSISKSFTAMVVVRILSNVFPDLDEAVLDVPIRQLIPSYNFTLIDRFRSENTNFRDLLSHRLCTLPERLGHFTSPYKNKAEYIYRQRYSESVCSSRTEFVYNNGLIQLAGEIAGAIANSTYEQLLTQLFTDIGMSASTFIHASDDLEGMELLARPYYRQDGITKRFNMDLLKPVSSAPGSGGILTTPNEFLKYLQLHLNNGKIGSEQVIPENLMKWIQKLSNRVDTPINFKHNGSELFYTDIGYGLGLFLGTYDGYLRIGHGGYLHPYLSLWTNVPHLDIGIFTTMNGPGILNQEELHVNILNILQNSTNANPMMNLQSPTPAPPSIWYESVFKASSQTLKKSQPETTKFNQENLVGIYGHPTSGDFNLTIVNETTLYMNYGQFGQAWLNQRGDPNSSAIYDLIWDSDIIQYFLADAPVVPLALVDFSEGMMAYIEIEDVLRIGYKKDEILDQLPTTPWDPESCFKERTHIKSFYD